MGWSDQEMAHLTIGDKRLDKRVKHTIEKISASSRQQLSSMFQNKSRIGWSV